MDFFLALDNQAHGGHVGKIKGFPRVRQVSSSEERKTCFEKADVCNKVKMTI